MKLSELIATIGDDKVGIQNLDECADTLNYNIKSGTKITFGTDQPLNPDGLEKLGLVLWLPRDAVKGCDSRREGEGQGGMNRTANEWAGVKVASVFSGSEAQARNVLRMALEDIAEHDRRDAALRRAAEQALTILRRDGVPGWGVAKDILAAAIAEAKS